MSYVFVIITGQLSIMSLTDLPRKFNNTYIFQWYCKWQARRQDGGGGGVRGVRMHPPRSQKGPPDGIVKDLKWYKNNVVMVGLTIFMYFQQFEDLKFLFFSGGACPRTPQKPLQSVQPSRIRRDCPDFTRESGTPTRLQSGHEYSNLKNSSHKPTNREIYFC